MHPLDAHVAETLLAVFLVGEEKNVIIEGRLNRDVNHGIFAILTEGITLDEIDVSNCLAVGGNDGLRGRSKESANGDRHIGDSFGHCPDFLEGELPH